MRINFGVFEFEIDLWGRGEKGDCIIVREMFKNFVVLAIDTSCDETSAAITAGRRVFANIVSSQVELHRKYGGVVPMIAQRAHRQRIDAVIKEAFKRANFVWKRFHKGKSERFNWRTIDGIAVTQGPGLAPALKVGLAKAKELAEEHDKPLAPVDHMEGHLLSSFCTNSKGNPSSQILKSQGRLPQTSNWNPRNFPLIGLLVSGGHTELVLMKDFGEYEILGETLDDAAGEAFEKTAKILKLGYPGGPIVERLAKRDGSKFDLPVPMVGKHGFNFSYSGLKTAVLYIVKDLEKEKKLEAETICGICAAFQKAVALSLVVKLKKAVKEYNVKGVLLGGGVMANIYIRRAIRKAVDSLPVHIPYHRRLFTDNAAMIGIAGCLALQRGEVVESFEEIKKLDREPGKRIEQRKITKY